MLTRWDPFQAFDRFFGSSSVFRGMPTDVYQRGDEYVVELDVPGLRPDSIEVTVEGNVLQVNAVRKASYVEGDQVLFAERPTGSVSRQLYLGSEVEGGEIQAEYRDGVLTIHVPMAERAKPHKIEIAAGDRQKTLTAQTA